MSDPATEPGSRSGPLEAIARRPRLAALIGAICIAFSGIFYRFAEVEPSTATVFRALYGLPILIAVAAIEWRRFGPLPLRTFGLAALAGVFFAGDLTFWHHTIEQVGAGLATVLGNLQVIVVGLVSWFVLKERPGQRVIWAVPIVLAGVVLISGVLDEAAYGNDPMLGVLLGIATAFFYTGYLFVIRRSAADYRRPAGPLAVSTAATAVVGALVGIALAELDPIPTWPAHGWLVALGITAQSAGYLLIVASLPRLPVLLASIILLCQPVVAVGLAMVLVGETPSPLQLAGVGLVIVGIAFATVRLPRRAPRPEPAG